MRRSINMNLDETTAESSRKLHDAFPCCKALTGPRCWEELCRGETGAEWPRNAEELVARIEKKTSDGMLPDYLFELARLELLLARMAGTRNDLGKAGARWQINPTLEVSHNAWNVPALVNGLRNGTPVLPALEDTHALVWYDSRRQQARVKTASREELFVLKILADDVALEDAAQLVGRHPDAVHNAFCRARDQGIIQGRASRLVRDDNVCTATVPAEVRAVRQFVLQWHITHSCDLHCKHCYDRSRRSPMTRQQGLTVLDRFGEFCRGRNVGGHVCFSGGNPLLSPHFFDLYQEAADRGHALSILGNPASRQNLERICAVKRPHYFQVSLEGLPDHNDSIRGEGFFARVIEFLGLLRDVGIPSVVMLTLTRDNMDQVLPLAERLRGHADQFTFNRLSPVGEGASLAMPPQEKFAGFLRDYQAACAENPILALKDNLFNIVRWEEELPAFDGCTGFGCGAAFNFVAVLPDGEVHACRKFPSFIGNVFSNSLLSIYDNDESRKYRTRPVDCRDCPLCPQCGGCLAVADGLARDCFVEKDPYCFLDKGDNDADRNS